MADDFSVLTDSDDEKAVEDLISQAMDHSVLEQIAAINCSSFSNSDNLPSHLENRFRKLKSLPTTAAVAGSRFPPAKSKSFTPSSGHDSNSNERRPPFSTGKSSPNEHSDENRDTAESELKPKCTNLNSELSNRNGLKSESKSKLKSRSGLSKSPSDSWSLSSPESEPEACDRRSREQHSDDNRDFKKSAKSKLKSRSKSGTGSYKSRWNESESDGESGTLSPPRRSIGCLWCSPKKEKGVIRKQGKEKRSFSKSLSSKDWGSEYDVEFLKTFSIKEQNKIMKKAMKEEEKINKEAEKIVKWAKQASDRMMNVSGLSLHDDDDEFSE